MLEDPKTGGLPVIVLPQGNGGPAMAGGLSKAPVAQVVDKRARMSKAKRAALTALAQLGDEFSEWGTPPYAVSLIARQLGANLPNLTKTMRLLERDGLVVRQVAKVGCWNAISRRHEPRNCVCYWLASTMEQDKARAAQWREGAGDRAQRAFDRLFTR